MKRMDQYSERPKLTQIYILNVGENITKKIVQEILFEGVCEQQAV